VSDTLQRLRAVDALPDGTPISVQLVAVPIADTLKSPDAVLTLEGIDLIVSPVHVRSSDKAG
jgi:hypothetical protein